MSKVIVVYGGGFQPFHAGHLSSYLQAKQKFGTLPNVDFYVTASDNTNTRPIPFKEKQWLAKQAGVSEQDFRNVVVKSPLNPIEILNQYDPDSDIFILVRSERDPVGYTKKDGSPGYYQPFVSLDKCVPFNGKTGGHGYVFVTKKEEFNIAGQTVYSGTQVRNMYANADDKLRNRIVHDMYPNSPNELAIRKVLDKYIGVTDNQSMAIKTSPIKKLKAKQLAEHISRMRPLIKEASVEQKYKFLKLMKEAYQLNELNLFKKKPVNKPQNDIEQGTSPNDYHTYFKPATTDPEVYHSPQEFLDKKKIDVLASKGKLVKEFDLDEGPTSDMRDFFSTQKPLNNPSPTPTQSPVTGPIIKQITRTSEEMAENRIIYAGSKVNLLLRYNNKPLLLNKEPVDYTDENLKKYAIVAYMYLRDKMGKKYNIQSIMRSIIVKPLEVHQTRESIDYLEEK